MIDYEEIVRRIKEVPMFDVRIELYRYNSTTRLIRLVIKSETNKKEVAKPEVSDYGVFVFIKLFMTGKELMEHLTSSIQIPWEGKSFGLKNERIERMLQFNGQYEYHRVSRGQRMGALQSNFPSVFYQLMTEEDASLPQFSHFSNQSLNAMGVPFFPTLHEAEAYYLYDCFLDVQISNRSAFQIAIVDDRAWIEQIVVGASGIRIDLKGKLLKECEIKAFGRKPGLLYSEKALIAMEQGIAVSILPEQLHICLTHKDEILDQRFISDKVNNPYFPSYGIQFERDEISSIKSLIALRGEGLHHDFKETFTPKIFEAICAFANREGGSIIIGVADNGEIVGVDGNPDKIRLQIEDTLEDIAVGKIICSYFNHSLKDGAGNERIVLELKVEEAPTKPVAIRQNKKDKYYIRRDGSNRLMKRDDFVHMINQALQSKSPNSLNDPLNWIR